MSSAKNEAKEELNIDVNPEFLKKVIIEDPLHPTMTSVFQLIFDGPYNFNKEEIDEIKILSLEEIKQNLDQLSPSTKITFKEAGIL